MGPEQGFAWSRFAEAVCEAVDGFLADMQAGKRPILILQAPPQHGKSQLISRLLPAFFMGAYPDARVAACSYALGLAKTMARDVRINRQAKRHKVLFPDLGEKQPTDTETSVEFTVRGASGSYVGVGIGGGITGKTVDLLIIDDPTKNAEEALSETIKEGHWHWYQTTSSTRMTERSGQIIMATSWAEDDLPGRIMKAFAGSPRLRVLKFPALNYPDESGYRPDLPLGALVPALKSEEFLREQKGLLSDYWWSAMYQQSPKAIGGNVFKEAGVRYYLPADLPKRFDRILTSWDCAFKDTDGADFVVGQVWGKVGANAYLLDQVRDRMSFTATVKAVIALRNKWPRAREHLIEDKANGPAVIDTLKAAVAGIIPIEPDGSKLARAHAVTSYWEAGNVWIPHPDIAPWIKAYLAEMTTFPAAANDDQVDSTTQALRRLYPLMGRLKISGSVLEKIESLRK